MQTRKLGTRGRGCRERPGTGVGGRGARGSPLRGAGVQTFPGTESEADALRRGGSCVRRPALQRALHYYGGREFPRLSGSWGSSRCPGPSGETNLPLWRDAGASRLEREPGTKLRKRLRIRVTFWAPRAPRGGCGCSTPPLSYQAPRPVSFPVETWGSGRGGLWGQMKGCFEPNGDVSVDSEVEPGRTCVRSTSRSIR